MSGYWMLCGVRSDMILRNSYQLYKIEFGGRYS